MSDDLAAQLHSHARLFRLGQHSAGHAQLAQLLDDAADRIAQLELPQRAIELASATGVSLERVLDVMNATAGHWRSAIAAVGIEQLTPETPKYLGSCRFHMERHWYHSKTGCACPCHS